MKASAALVLTAAGIGVQAQDARTFFRSPNGLTEECTALAHFPGGVYSNKDAKAEKEFCAIDIYAQTTAICPKTWSTSPGTMIYGTDGVAQSTYEASMCAGKAGHTKLAKFKNTMNSNTTSSTYSASPLMYYHFSRYFQTNLLVPPSVRRTFDKDEHFKRVSSRAQGLSKMNKAAWGIMQTAEQNPASYLPTDDLFTPDRRQIYGILIKDKGSLAGAEIQGTEADAWGVGQNNDFQNTPGFTALRTNAPLAQAISTGTVQALQDPLMAKAVGQVDARQVAYWMQDVTEITLLDYIFSQQDRIMNIDFVWNWVYADASGAVTFVKAEEKVSRARMGKIVRPAGVPANAILIQQAAINDNDAGGKVQYTNFTKKTQMLEKIRHYNPETYRRLVALNKDFAAKGSLYRYVAQEFGLNEKNLAQIVSNTQVALGILKQTCQAGQLRFDLKPAEFFTGQKTDERVDCENP